MSQDVMNMPQLHEMSVKFNETTGEIQYNEGDRPLRLVSIAEIPELDVRKGQRNPEYLEEKVLHPSQENTIQINEPFTLFPMGFFGKENPLGIVIPELSDAYVILQGNNRHELLSQKAAQNHQLFTDLDVKNKPENFAEYDKQAIKFKPVRFVILSKDEAGDRDLVMWRQVSSNDAVKSHTPAQNRDAALNFRAYLKEHYPKMKDSEVDARVAKAFGVKPSRVFQWKAVAKYDPDLLEMIDADRISMDEAIKLWGFFSKNQKKIGLPLLSVLSGLWELAVNEALKGKAGKVAKIVGSTIEAYMKTFGLDYTGKTETPEPTETTGETTGETDDEWSDSGEGSEGSQNGGKPEPEPKTLEQLLAEFQSINTDTIIDRLDVIVAILKSGKVETTIIGEGDKAREDRKVMGVGASGEPDGLAEVAITKVLKAVTSLQNVLSKVETVNEETKRKQEDEIRKQLEAAQKAQGEANQAPFEQQPSEPVAV